ncbi:MAG: putative ABC exporter domain-containing protein, partial [Erysipelotrichaceae bacterium]|nr:putative ABC exporter domain-containing protein [Erysipelotrichaceae bacterium]
LGVLVFFRAIGNPLNADTKMDYFRLIPEKTWKKLFWSVAGGSVNCLLDLLPGMIAGSLLMAVNPFKVLVYLPLIISVDFYATSVGTFLDLSIPRSTGTTFRQTIQILFIYFGLIPDIAIMAVGLALHYASWSSLICTLINLYLGLLFLGLSGVFVEPYGGRSIETDGSETVDVKKTRKVFSETGIACVIILAGASLLQLGLVGIFRNSLETIADSEWGIWLIKFLPMYLFAVPLGLLYLRKVPVYRIEQKSLNKKQLLILPVICIFLMYSGNLLGTLVTSLLSNLVTPEPVVNPLMNLTSSGTIVQRLIFMVILAPVIEEYIFRKQLIDRLHIYGGRQAVILSGIMFGLFHGNFSQLFYAAALGILFGYVYLKTGKLRYTIGLHMTVNFMGGILGPQLLENASGALSKFEEMSMLSPWKFLLQPSILFLAVYLILMLVLVLAGFVLLVQQMREVSFEKEIHQLPKGKVLAVTLQNPGMILFMITCLGLIVYTLI